MALSEDRLSLLYRVSQTFNSSLDLDQVLNRVMDEVIAATRAERGFVVLRQEDGAFRFGAARGLDQKSIEAPEFQVSRGLVDRVAAEGKPLLTSDAQSDSWLAGRESVRFVGVRAIMCVPLELKGRVDGVIYVDSRLQAGVFSPDDVAMLQGIAASAAIAIDNARLYQVAVEKGRMERELQVARGVQSSLLPQDVPSLPGWEFSAWWQPAREVSGDFYDFVPFRDGNLALIIGDVTDKGMPAALFMASARSVVRASVAAAYEPALAVEQANDSLAADAPNGMFVTLLAVRLTPDHGAVHVVNAGNHRPILYRAASGDLTEVGRPGLPLAIDAGQPYHAAEELLLPGDFLLLHTDGLTDANNAAHELFGIERVRQVLIDHATSTAGDLRDQLRQAIAAFTGSVPPYDDVTFLIARRTM